jgi:chromosome segregation ATPase
MASTDEKCPATGASDSSAVEGPHGERRRRAHEVLSVQRSHLDRLENELTEQLQQLIEEVAQSARLAESAAAQGESAALAALQSQFEALKRQYAALDSESEQLRGQLEQAHVERGRAEQELRIRDTLLKEAQGNDEQRRVESATLRGRLTDAEAQLAAARERQSALERELASQPERAGAEREETKAQRRRIARALKQQHADRIAEVERRKAELEALRETSDTHLAEQVASAQAELLANTRELNELRETLARRTGEVEEAQRKIEALQTAAPSGFDPEELRKLQEERDSLAERLSEAEAARTERAEGGDADSQEMDDMRRRFEMAVDEVRDLKRANAEMESKLKARPGSPSLITGGGGMDWESQKQRLLASLEADGEEEEEEEATVERTNIEGTIRITDQIVAQKDQEIAELKLLLEQGRNVTDTANQSAAVAELLDHDDVIRQEREKLMRAQAEWRDKIGHAEIDISVQRAKIARERAELDEKIRQFEAAQERRGPNDHSDSDKPTRGRWLARLGLNIDESK